MYLKGQAAENGFSVTFENGYKATVAWKRTYGAGTDVPFEITFFDANGELVKDINYAIAISDSNGQQIYLDVGDETTSYLGVKAPEGIDTQTIYILSEGMYSMSLALTGSGITNWENYVVSETMFEIGKSGESSMSAPVHQLHKLLFQLGSKTMQDGGLTDRLTTVRLFQAYNGSSQME